MFWIIYVERTERNKKNSRSSASAWSDVKCCRRRKLKSTLSSSFVSTSTSHLFLPTDYTATYYSNIAKWWTRDRLDFCFRSRYFRFRPSGRSHAFKVNIRVDSYLDRFSRDSVLRAESHTREFGMGEYFRSSYSASGVSNWWRRTPTRKSTF